MSPPPIYIEANHKALEREERDVYIRRMASQYIYYEEYIF